MSLEVTLIPLAFIVINMIDKNYYKSWIDKKRIVKPTGYNSIEPFLLDLNKTGYKYSVIQGTVRICAGNERIFYFFNQNNQWVLSFSEYDNPNDVAQFLEVLSNVSGGRVSCEMPKFPLLDSGKKIVNGSYAMPSLENRKVSIYPTIYNDKSLLLDALNKMEIPYTRSGDDIEFTKDGAQCTFLTNSSGQYYMRVLGNVSEEEVYRSIQELDIVYKKDVQRQAYESVMREISRHNATVVNEVINEDDTIVLTLNVEG